MRAVTWQGRGDVEVTEVPDPHVEQPTDVDGRQEAAAGGYAD